MPSRLLLLSIRPTPFIEEVLTQSTVTKNVRLFIYAPMCKLLARVCCIVLAHTWTLIVNWFNSQALFRIWKFNFCKLQLSMSKFGSTPNHNSRFKFEYPVFHDEDFWTNVRSTCANIKPIKAWSLLACKRILIAGEGRDTLPKIWLCKSKMEIVMLKWACFKHCIICLNQSTLFWVRKLEF